MQLGSLLAKDHQQELPSCRQTLFGKLSVIQFAEEKRMFQFKVRALPYRVYNLGEARAQMQTPFNHLREFFSIQGKRPLLGILCAQYALIQLIPAVCLASAVKGRRTWRTWDAQLIRLRAHTPPHRYSPSGLKRPRQKLCHNCDTEPVSAAQSDFIDDVRLLILRKLLKTKMRPKNPAYRLARYFFNNLS
jgi:hypothetical protein